MFNTNYFDNRNKFISIQIHIWTMKIVWYVNRNIFYNYNDYLFHAVSVQASLTDTATRIKSNKE